jgi:hypothetical protein
MKARMFLCGVAAAAVVAGCTGLVTALPKTGIPVVSGASSASPSNAASSAAMPAMTPGTFTQIGTLPGCDSEVIAALAGNGKLIMVGCGEFNSTKEFDPATGKVTEVDADTEAAIRAVTLLDGRVFVLMEMAGGALVIDPKSGKSGGEIDSPGDEDSPEIGYDNATLLLSDGRVLVVGGSNGLQGEVGFPYAVLFDPATGTMSRTGSMKTARADFTAVKLADGRVLVAGGEVGSDLDSVTAKSEMYDPGTAKFTATGSLPKPRYSAVGALLPGGKVLVAGGSDEDGDPLSSAELFDPRTGKFGPTGSMTTARGDHEGEPPLAVVLPDGRVVVMGGEGEDLNLIPTAEIYDPATGKFKSDGAIGEPIDHLAGAFVQADGTLLVVGGNEGGSATLWRYQP